MDEREVLIESIKAIKEHAKSQVGDIRMGLFMALQTIKNRVLDEELIAKLDLDEDFEDKFFD
jgi:hypothetical protein